jgi:hypothetical protein
MKKSSSSLPKKCSFSMFIYRICKKESFAFFNNHLEYKKVLCHEGGVEIRDEGGKRREEEQGRREEGGRK